MLERSVITKPFAAIAFATVVCPLYQGCSGVHLYHPEQAQRAATAVEGFDQIVAAVDVELEKEKSNQLALLAAEVAGVQDFVKRDLEAALAIVVTSDEPLAEVWLDNMLGTRLVTIGIAPTNLQAVAESRAESPIVKRAVDTFRDELVDEFNYPRSQLTCTVGKGISNLKVELIDAAFIGLPGNDELPDEDRLTLSDYQIAIADAHKRFRTKCEDWLTTLSSIFNDGSEGARLLAERTDAQERLDAAKKRESEVTQAFKDAKKRLDGRTVKEPDKGVSEIINEEIEKLRGLLGGAGELAGVFGEAEAIEQRLKSIDDILGTVTAGEGETPPQLKLSDAQKRLATALAGLPNLAGQLVALSRTLNRPPVTALIMIKQELEARKQAAAAERARGEAEVVLIEARYQALVDELVGYNKVVRLLNHAQSQWAKADLSSDPFTLSYDTAMKQTKGPDGDADALKKAKKTIKLAIVVQIYEELKSWQLRFESEYRQIALDYEASLAISRARVGEWHALIGPLIAQQKAYHDAGIKPETIAALGVELLKAVSLVGIAVGVD